MNVAQLVPLADTWGMHGDDVGAGWMALTMIGMVLFWGAVILGIVWLVRGGVAGRPSPPGEPESALQILERRFAEGTISPEDYEARRRILIEGRSR
jgi:putative membrane protein